jgi:hypothetical protein
MKRVISVTILAFSFYVHAEPTPTPIEKCRVDMEWPLRQAHRMYKRGVAPTIIGFLASTDKSLGGAGRWLLTTGAYYLEVVEFSEEQFVTKGLLLCDGKQQYWNLPERPWQSKWPNI